MIATRLEINARMSQLFGEHGDSQGYAGGINWFVDGTHLWKLTFDVTWLNRNAASNSGPDLRAGDDGVVVRSQLQAGFWDWMRQVFDHALFVESGLVQGSRMAVYVKNRARISETR